MIGDLQVAFFFVLAGLCLAITTHATGSGLGCRAVLEKLARLLVFSRLLPVLRQGMFEVLSGVGGLVFGHLRR